MNMYPKPRKKSVLPVDYRNKILVAAIKVFAQKGFVASTMSDVSIHAKVGIGTLYNYFRNKDDLLLQCMKKTIEDEIHQIKDLSSNVPDPVDKLQTFFQKHTELMMSKPYIARFLVVELRQSEGFYKRNPSYNPMNYYLDYVRGICKEAMETGRIRTVDPDALSYMIIGAMDMILTQWLISGKTMDMMPLTGKIRNIIENGLLQ
ncbi:MAG: TetR/AcrR family transcriptional regulator [Candidatus Cloacimonadaceae bacterium]|nr:TetR/AcrR family transcriptional regulator [Candidatus Cloacimonadaceae bacterium]